MYTFYCCMLGGTDGLLVQLMQGGRSHLYAPSPHKAMCSQSASDVYE